MRTLLMLFSFGICGSAFAQDYRAPVEWELNVEGGLDLRRVYDDGGDNVIPPTGLLRDGLRQNQPSPFVALSAMRRIPGLRAFYGLRVEGHTGTLAFDREGANYEVDHRTAAALLSYRFFPLDLQGDCDCPTWGNDPWLKKALFLEAGLGVGYQAYRGGSAVAAGAPDQTSWGYGFAARIGLSHRLSKALDLFAAAGVHGVLDGNNGTHRDALALRPALGITYRPRG